MPALPTLIALMALTNTTATEAQTPKPVQVSGAESLTIYNQNFAVVRHPLRMNLKKGANSVLFENVTGQLEPDSVVLRDLTGKHPFRIQEQSYRNDTASMDKLLTRFEGKTLQFLVQPASGTATTGTRPEIVTGKLVRAGSGSGNVGFGGGFDSRSMSSVYTNSVPIVEVDGKLRFGLPGQPLFPAGSMNGLLLYPTLQWTLFADVPGPLDAELAYVTSGFTWEASYNLVAPEQGDKVDLTGWVTMTNTSGRTFPNAHIQLVAGDVHKIQLPGGYGGGGTGGGFGGPASPPTVSEKSFDEYHLYTLRSPTTLRDREQKQVELARASGVMSKRIYVYDGTQTDPSQYDWRNPTNYDPSYDKQQNTKVWVMREFANTAANGLGIPLPRGRMRLYRRENATGALQFVGEALIGHTPKNETIRLYTGDAFDIVGEHRMVDNKNYLTQTWEIKVRNHKTEPVEVRIVEHLYGPYVYDTWNITATTDPWIKMDAHTVEYRVLVKPEEEKTVTYTVEYK